MTNNSFDFPIGRQLANDGAPSRRVVFKAGNHAARAHGSDQSKALHPDWRESSGIALPTVEDLHYAHYFLNRATDRGSRNRDGIE